MHTDELLNAVLSCGASKAAPVHAGEVITSPVFFDVCKQNSCGNFGRCWMCPPELGEISELIARVQSYQQGILYQSISEIEDSFDIEGMQDAAFRHAQLSQRIEEALRPVLGEKHLHLSCGGCRLCEVCAKRTGEPCRFPDKALPSMEGYGIDVYATVKPTPLKYINGQNTVTYFGIVLF